MSKGRKEFDNPYSQNGYEQDRGEAEVKPRPYRLGRFSKLPAIVKALIVKFWFAGAVYFFVGWGTFINSIDQLDVVIALGLILGLITDLLINRFFAAIDNDKKSMKKYMMFSGKKWISFIFNILYGILLSAAIAYTYHLINFALISARGLPEETVLLAADPILYGIFFLVYDLLFLTLRNLLFYKKYRKGTAKNV